MTDQSNSRTFDRTLVVMAVFAALTALLALVAAVRAGDSPAEAAVTAEGHAHSATQVAASTGPTTADIELSEWAIRGDLEGPAGALTINLHNADAMVHNLVFENGASSGDLNPGETVTFEVGELEPGTYEIFCDIAGHQGAGMEARLVVGGESASSDSDDHSSGHGDMSPAEMDQMMIDSMLASLPRRWVSATSHLSPPKSRTTGPRSSTSVLRSSNGRSPPANSWRPGPTTKWSPGRGFVSTWATRSRSMSPTTPSWERTCTGTGSPLLTRWTVSPPTPRMPSHPVRPSPTPSRPSVLRLGCITLISTARSVCPTGCSPRSRSRNTAA